MLVGIHRSKSRISFPLYVNPCLIECSRTFGIQSPLKNALDWGTTAATGPEGPFVNIFYGKPAAIIGAGLRYGVGDINQDSALRRMCEWLEMDLIQAPPIALDLSDHRSLFDLQTTDVADPMVSSPFCVHARQQCFSLPILCATGHCILYC